MAIPNSVYNRPMFNQNNQGNQGLGQLIPEAQQAQTQGILSTLPIQTAAQPLQIPEYQVAAAQPTVRTAGIAVKPTDLIDGKPSWEFIQQRLNQLWGREDSTDQKDDEDFYLFLKQIREQYGDYAVQSSESSSSPGSLDLLISEAKPDPEESAEGEGAEGEGAVSADNVKLLSNAANQETNKALAEGKVSPTDAENAKINAAKQVGALEKTEVGDEKAALKAQLDALGIKDFSVENYNKQAKELLGMDPEGEPDVPTWAAPIFLFGLQLMKGPVSSKQEGQTGFGGFLGDIGEAGTAAFGQFGKERDRRQRQKSAVAQLSAKLRGQDISRYTAARKEAIRSREWQMTHGLALTKFGNEMMDQSLTRMTKGLDSGKTAEVMSLFSDLVGSASEPTQKQKDVKGYNEGITRQRNTAAILRNPLSRLMLEKTALSQIHPNADIVSIETPTGKLFYDKIALSSTFRGLSKAEKTKYGGESGLLKAVIDTPALEIGKKFAVTTGTPDLQYELVPKDGGLVQPTWYNKATGDVVKKESAVLKDKPQFKQITITGEDGVAMNLLIDPVALSRSNKTINEILADPAAGTKYPKIVQNLPDDYSRIAGAVAPIELYGPNNTKQKGILYKQADADFMNKIRASDTLRAEWFGLTPQQKQDRKVNAGIIQLLPNTFKTKPNEEYMSLKADGSGWFKVVGQPGTIKRFIDAKAREAFDAKIDFTRGANNSAATILNIFSRSQPVDQIKTASQITEWKNALVGALRQLGPSRLTFSGSVQALQGYKRTGDAATAEANGLIDGFMGNLEGWANGVAKTSEDRQRIKSLFIDLAFQVASSREAGKLTDQDVKWAFKTMGFDDGSFFQSPRKIISGVYQGMKTLNERLESEAIRNLSDAEAEKLRTAKDPNDPRKGDWLEGVLGYRLDLVGGQKELKYQGEAQPADASYKPFYRFDKFIEGNYPGGFGDRSAAGGPSQVSASNRLVAPIAAMNIPQSNTYFNVNTVNQDFKLEPRDAVLFKEIFGFDTTSNTYSILPNSPAEAMHRVRDWAAGVPGKQIQGREFLERLEKANIILP